MSNNNTFTDYNEIVCQAIDNIVTTRLQEVKFDETIICTIVNIINREQGEYEVSNGSTIFKAYSDNKYYAKDQQVYVLVPKGDYANELTILRAYKNEEETGNVYIEPSRIVYPVQVICEGIDDSQFLQNEFVAWSDEEPQLPVSAFDSLVIEAEFQNTDEIKTEEYGVTVSLLTQNTEVDIDLTSSMMFGDPYNFITYFKQSIQSSILQQLDPDDKIYNVIIRRKFGPNDKMRNLKVYLGKDLSQMSDLPKLEIFTYDTLEYQGSNSKQLQVAWYNFDEGQYQSIDSVKNNLSWERYTVDSGWQKVEVENDPTSVYIEMDSTIAETQIRAVVNFSDSQKIISNTIKFINREEKTLADESSAFTLVVDNTHYVLYDERNELTESSIQYHTISLNFNPRFKTNEDGLKGKKIEWVIPKNNSMIKITSQGTDAILQLDENNTDYYIYSADDASNNAARQLKYKLSPIYQKYWMNNFIECRIYYTEDSYIPIIQRFTFGSKGIQGTDYSLIISTSNGELGWIEGTESLTYVATLIDPEGQDITTNATVAWEWSQIQNYSNPDYEISSNSNSITITRTNTTLNKLRPYTLQVKATINNKLTLIKKQPIVYMAQGYADCFVPLINPIYYNSNGELINYSQLSELTLYNTDNTISQLNSPAWSLTIYYVNGTQEDSYRVGIDTEEPEWYERVRSSIPYFTNRNNIQILTPTKFCEVLAFTQQNYRINLILRESEEIIWSSPILLEVDQYASSLLNDWDGTFKINNEDNYLLSASVIAGTKDTENRFTGVIVGDIGNAYGESISSGLLGLKGGIQTFKLGTDGNLTLGSTGSGQISFDGTKGIIQSTAGTGMSIDLDDGSIKASKFNLNAENNGNKIILNNQADDNVPYFQIGKDDGEHIILDKDNNLSIVARDLSIASTQNINLLPGTATASLSAVQYAYSDMSLMSLASENNKYKVTINNTNNTSATNWMYLAYDLSIAKKYLQNTIMTFSTKLDTIASEAELIKLEIGIGYIEDNNTIKAVQGVEYLEWYNKSLITWETSIENDVKISDEDLQKNLILYIKFSYDGQTISEDLEINLFETKLELGSNNSPIWSPSPNEALISDYNQQGIYMENGLLAINASAIRTGVLSSNNGNLVWNLNDSTMSLANDAFFVSNANFAIGATGLTFAITQNLQAQLTNQNFIYYTPNYTIEQSTQSGPGYYYKELKTNDFGTRLYIRDLATGKILDNKYLEPESDYRIVCNSNGEFLKPGTSTVLTEPEQAQGGKYYWLKFDNDTANYYISCVYSNKNIFSENTSNAKAEVKGGPTTSTAYTGSAINLTSSTNEIILSGTNNSWIKITGNRITTSSNYIVPW